MQFQTSASLFIYKSKYSINIDILPRKKELSSEVVAQPTQQVKAVIPQRSSSFSSIQSCLGILPPIPFRVKPSPQLDESMYSNPNVA